MKTFASAKTLLPVIFTLFFIFSCSTPSILSGQMITESRTPGSFNSVTLAMSADVYLTQGKTMSVEIEADQDVIEFIETIVKNNELIIRNENLFGIRKTGQVVIHITIPEVEGISVTGSGNIYTETAIASENISISISGSGSVNINELYAASIHSVITGSGNINISGRAKQPAIDVTITGSGGLKAEQLQVGKAHVNITGSGSARLNVTDELNALITGSGDVIYNGNPLINVRSTGSGRTTSVN